MAWVRYQFKSNKVWVYADDQDQPVVWGGLVDIRYKPKDDRTYRASPDKVTPLPGPSKRVEDTEAAPLVREENPPPRKKEARTEPSPPEQQPGDVPITKVESGAWEGTTYAQPPFLGTQPPIQVWTDGACSKNPGPAGLGVVLISGQHRRELSEYLGEGTNNIAELAAILRGLQVIKDPARTVFVFTDSSYAIGVIWQGWKARANPELIEQVRQESRRFADLRVFKVAGHAGVVENERCDELAREAIRTRGGER